MVKRVDDPFGPPAQCFQTGSGSPQFSTALRQTVASLERVPAHGSLRIQIRQSPGTKDIPLFSVNTEISLFPERSATYAFSGNTGNEYVAGPHPYFKFGIMSSYVTVWYESDWNPSNRHRRQRREETVISTRNVNPSKLEGMLEDIFRGAYDVKLRHDTFTVVAKRRLSHGEIQSCSW
ncbi:hypothetical protein KVR01_003472 [Diaporthe batatas]|uniref:uncharacterized protein n=1 Tax=Diaporthe batatas TaxID=748121 RepID=UPI001D051B63|nr:uncharacterized protein KVR01_003472 [Diaporthe batatas]KAG8167783.1 hypothetical protein KVR01_003472 [Diaporthe batatas]